MLSVIDTPYNVRDHVRGIRQAGVDTVVRYYNHQNSARFPSKRLEPSEAEAIIDAGMSVAVVFQQRGGAGGRIEDLDRQSGLLDAQRALNLADELGQPAGTAIYFAVDHDYYRGSELEKVAAYFQAIRETLREKYRVGCYGSGTVASHMVRAGSADLIWLAGATGWSGTRDVLQSDAWALFQKDLNKVWGGGAFGYDGNVVNPRFRDFGQFGLGEGTVSASSAPAATIMEVVARSGLNVRRGPGNEYSVLTTLPYGTLVRALDQAGLWTKVDIEGDGAADGFMHRDYLRVASGGLPIADAAGGRPIDIARAEMALDVREVSGAASNPRIVMYHASTRGGAASDEVAWCSSFVNYCVEQAGMRGTDSKWAMSWHDESWGGDVTDNPRQGDIAVFRRRSRSASGEIMGGHVAFWLDDLGNSVSVLGGNQSNRIRVSGYPKHGVMPGTNLFFELLSIRRPPA